MKVCRSCEILFPGLCLFVDMVYRELCKQKKESNNLLESTSNVCIVQNVMRDSNKRDFYGLNTGRTSVISRRWLLILGLFPFPFFHSFCYVWTSAFAVRSLCQLSSRRLLLALVCRFLERMKGWQCLSCLKCVSRDSLTKQMCAVALQSSELQPRWISKQRNQLLSIAKKLLSCLTFSDGNVEHRFYTCWFVQTC